MAKKKMPLPENLYKKATLSTGQSWYLKFWQTDPSTGEKVRFRKTFNLNRIDDEKERKKAAEAHIQLVNLKLAKGWPFRKVVLIAPPNTNIIKALELAKGKASSSDRENTNRNFRSMYNIFTDYLHLEGLAAMKIGEWKKRNCVAFLDHAIFVREVSNRTYNNYLERLVKLFAELKKRGYVKNNHWKKFKRKKPGPKRRRAFNGQEKDMVANYISQFDKWLTLGILLQYHCFIRPVELRRLRFQMFDQVNGIIHLTGDETKNRENALVTIPNTLLNYLIKFNFTQWPQHYLIFGIGGQPHPDRCCSHDMLNRRHKKILQDLNGKGVLSNIKGLSFYSWKDTGALELFKRKVNILEIMAQLRHKDLATTQRYCKSLYSINLEIKHLDNVLIKV